MNTNFNGGYINTIMTIGEEIYAGTSTHGVFRSVNNGDSWVQINSGLGNSLLIQSLSHKDNYIFKEVIAQNKVTVKYFIN